MDMTRKRGFTLIEMLVVMGIIAILSGALLVGFGKVTKSAQKARAQETVSNVATALSVLLQKEGRWPKDEQKAIQSYAGSDNGNKGMVEVVARVLAKYKVLSISTKKNDSTGELTLVGTDRCGVVDPWAQAVLKANSGTGQGVGKELRVPSGGTVKDHVIYYAIDEDFDGVTEANVCGEKIYVRAPAIAWCAGADGVLGSGYKKRSKANSDNVYSWSRAQEVQRK